MDSAYSAEAINEIERLTREAVNGRTVSFHQLNALPNVVFIQKPDGAVEQIVAPRAKYDNHLETPRAFAVFVADREKERSGGKVFYDKTKLVYVFSERYEHDRAVCALKFSPQWNTLISIVNRWFSMKEFVRLLRIDFAGCLPTDILRNSVANVKWSTGAEGQSEITHGRASVSRSAVAQVRGETAIPEEQYLTIQVWENHPYVARVDCAVEIDADSQKFALTPYPLSMRRAVDKAVEDLESLLISDQMPPAYLGSP